MSAYYFLQSCGSKVIAEPSIFSKILGALMSVMLYLLAVFSHCKQHGQYPTQCSRGGKTLTTSMPQLCRVTFSICLAGFRFVSFKTGTYPTCNMIEGAFRSCCWSISSRMDLSLSTSLPEQTTAQNPNCQYMTHYRNQRRNIRTIYLLGRLHPGQSAVIKA